MSAPIEPFPKKAGGPDLGRLFQAATPTAAWSPREVTRETLDELHALASLCPASAPRPPAAVLFVTSEPAKVRLLRHAPIRQRHRVLLAPVCAVVGYDPTFAEHLVIASAPKLRRSAIRETARRTAELQGPYLVLAARTLGLEASPLEGFDLAGLTREFFPGSPMVASFLCALGYPLDA
jgi:nitroreductase